jgi:hypothetical protein
MTTKDTLYRLIDDLPEDKVPSQSACWWASAAILAIRYARRSEVPR